MATDNGYVGFMLKPRRWAAEPAVDVPTVTLDNGKLAEVIASVLYAYDATAQDLVHAVLDHATGGLKVYLAGGTTVTTSTAAPGTATLSNVASSASSVTVLAANTARLGVKIVNDSTQDLYLKFGATASTSSYSVHLYPGQTFEEANGYTGKIDGIWASANGNARVTELTA